MKVFVVSSRKLHIKFKCKVFEIFLRFSFCLLLFFSPLEKMMESIDQIRLPRWLRSLWEQHQRLSVHSQPRPRFRFLATIHVMRTHCGTKGDTGQMTIMILDTKALDMTTDTILVVRNVETCKVLKFHYKIYFSCSCETICFKTRLWLPHHSIGRNSWRERISLCVWNCWRHQGWRSWNLPKHRLEDWRLALTRIRSDHRCWWHHFPYRLSVRKQRSIRSTWWWTRSSSHASNHHQAFGIPRITQIISQSMMLPMYYADRSFQSFNKSFFFSKI